MKKKKKKLKKPYKKITSVQLIKQEKLLTQKKVKRFFALFVIIVLSMIIYHMVEDNSKNKKIYNELINSKESMIEIEYYNDTIELWDKTVEYIKNCDKTIYFTNKKFSYQVDNKKIKKKITFKMNLKVEDKSVKEFKNYHNISIRIDKRDDAIKSIKLKLDRTIFTNDYIDIYSYSNGKYYLYDPANKINSDSVEIDISKNDYKEFLLVYVPVSTVNVSNREFNIKNGGSEEIGIKIEPENATNHEIYFEYSDTNIANIVENNKIQGLSVGQTDIMLKVHNENVEERIGVTVLEVLKDIKLNKVSVNVEVGDSYNVIANSIPENSINKELVWSSSNESIAIVENGKITGKKTGKCTIVVENVMEPIIEKTISVTVVDKKDNTRISSGSETIDLTCINGILIVNKKYSLPNTYAPGLNSEAYQAYKELKKAAASLGFNMPLLSGYRSYQTQVNLYASYVKKYGEEIATTFSAKAGQSEHQTGLAFDVGSINDNYGTTAAGKWLAENAHQYGFIIRYPKGKEAITGYQYEPWHIRYLGVTIATDVFNKGVCLEEYLGVN
ncbi:MAG: D-alanyl-D-alanine carboxypeptidase family protein [Clostridia bacterium]|nr:D-alanyl-D-alanine carboxypeptidase family protein [Clostridia bacterium]